jgi:hypothetical protein
MLLDLIDSAGNPSEQFDSFRNIRGEDEYRTALQEWLRATYADVLVYCDPTTDSYDRVLEAFRGYEPQGQRKGMASLFLGLWRHAGLPAAALSQAKERTSAPPRGQRSKSSSKATGGKGNRNLAGGGGHGGGGLSTDGLPPGLVGLLHQIPRNGQPWTVETRDNFLDAFTAVLNFSVPVGEPADEEDSTDEEVE